MLNGGLGRGLHGTQLGVLRCRGAKMGAGVGPCLGMQVVPQGCACCDGGWHGALWRGVSKLKLKTAIS